MDPSSSRDLANRDSTRNGLLNPPVVLQEQGPLEGTARFSDGLQARILAVPHPSLNDLLPEAVASPSSPTVKKVKQVANLVPKKLGLFDRFVSSVVKKGIHFVTGDADLSAINNESRTRINNLTGNDHLSGMLEASAPKLGQLILEIVKDKLTDDKRNPGIQAALQDEQDLITDCLNATLLRMAANLAERAKIEERINDDTPVQFSDLIALLLKVSGDHLMYLNNQIAEIEAEPDEKIRESRMQQLLVAFKGDLLQLLLPQGANDIAIPGKYLAKKVKNIIYDMISDSLPELVLKYYHQVMDPIQEKPESDSGELLKALPGGDVLNEMADTLAHLLPSKTPAVIQTQITEIASKLGDRLFIDQPDPAVRQQLDGWLGEGINQLAQSNKLGDLWSFSESYLRPALKKIFLNLATHCRVENSPNVMNDISTHLLTIFDEFINAHKEKINALSVSLASETDPKEQGRLQERLIAAFMPLSDELIQMIGFDQPDRLPVPLFLREIFIEKLHEELPHQLLKIYQDYANIEQALPVEDPDANKFTQFAQVLTANIASFVMEKVSKEGSSTITQFIDAPADQAVAQSQLLSTVISSLMNNGIAQKAGNILKNQCQVVLNRIFVKIANYHGSARVENLHAEEDLFSNLVVQVIKLCKSHIGRLDVAVLDRISHYRNLPDEEKKAERESLIQEFMPMANKLLELAGFTTADTMPVPSVLKNALFNKLKEDLLPGFIFDAYIGMTANVISLEKIESELSATEFGILKDTWIALAKKAVAELKGILKEDSAGLVGILDQALPVQKLPDNLQNWLSTELSKVSRKRGVKDGFTFIENYLQDLLTAMMGHLAIQYNEEHPLEAEDDSNGDVLKNATLQLVNVVMKSLHSLNRDYLTDINELVQLPQDQFEQRKAELINQLEPVILKLLEGLGFEGQQDLAIPDPLKAIVWNMLTKTTLPQLVFEKIQSVAALQPEVSEDAENLNNLRRLHSTLDVIGNNAIPMVQASLKKRMESADSLITTRITAAINRVIPGLITQETVDGLLTEIVDPKEYGTKKLARVLPKFLLSFIEPIIVNIAAANGNQGDVLEQMVIKVLNLVESHFSEAPLDLENLVASEEELDEATMFGQDQDEVDVPVGTLEGAFGPFIDEILESAGIEPENIPVSVRKQALKQLLMLYKTVRAPLDIQKEYRVDLNQLFGIDIESLQNSLDEYSETVSESSSLPMEEILNFVSDKIQGQIKNYLSEHADVVPNMINNLLPIEKLDRKNQRWLTRAIKKIVKSEDAHIQDLWKYSSTVIRTAMMKLFVDVASQLPEADDPEVAKEKLIPAVFAKIASIAGENLEGIKAQVIEINRLEPDARKLALRQLFTPMASAFLDMVGPDPLVALPIPPALKETLLNNLASDILPDFLVTTYGDIASWVLDKKDNEHEIIDMFINYRPGVPLAAAKVIARFATNYIPVLLDNPANKAAEKMQEAVVNFMKRQSGEDAENILAYLDDHSAEIHEWMQANLSGLIDDDLELKDHLLPATEKYIEAAMLKIMLNVLTKANAKTEDPKFMIQLGLEMVHIANEHFEEIIRIMKADKRNLASDVMPEEMARQYGNSDRALTSFHVALDPSIEGEAAKEALAKEKFFVPFTEQLLKLAGVTQENLPVPSALRAELFELVKNELGPVMIKALLDSLDIDKMMLKVLEAVNKADVKPKNTEDEDIELSEEERNEQAAIDDACGSLFLNVMRLLPNKEIRTFFSNDKIKNLSAHALGKILRDQLGSMNILHLVNDALAQGLPSLNAQITMDEEGNLIVPDDLHFILPTTPEETAAQDALKVQEKIETQEKLIKELAKTIGYQIKSRINNFFTAPWAKFQEKLDNWIESKMGPNCMKVKRKLDKFFHAVVFSVISALIYVLFIPFNLILRKILKKKATDIVSMLHMDIHKNLVFKMADTFMTRINEEEQQVPGY